MAAEEPKAAKAPAGTVNVGGVILPKGLSLVRVSDPSGSDANALFYLAGTVMGVNMSFEVGDWRDLQAMFGGTGEDMLEFKEVTAMFDVARMSQSAFDADYVVMGTADEVVGSTESLQSQVERDIRAVGVDALPQWIRNSKRAVTLVAVGAREGWASQKTWGELAKTDAFEKRFRKTFSVVSDAMQVDDPLLVVNEILAREAAIRDSLRTYRGPDAKVTNQYVGGLIESGWSVAEIDDMLSAEKRIRETPGALRNLNQIREVLGQERLSAGQFAQVMTGAAPAEVLESVNDALRKSVLAEQGVRIGAAFAESLGDGSGTVQSADYMKQIAGQAAQNILRFKLELDAGKFGLSQEDILAAAFDQERSGEVNERLAKFARERASLGQGLSGPQGFVDAEGRLKLQGLADL